MALRWMDSFDHYTTVLQKWDAEGGVGQPIGSSFGRFVNGYQCQFNRSTFLRKDLDAQPTWILGLALRLEGGYVDAANCRVFTLYDAGSSQMDLRFESGTGKLQITRNGTQLGSTATAALLLNVWHYIEFKVTIHNSTGIAIARVNGVDVINVSGADTQATANATADRIHFAEKATTGGSFNWHVDDIYACDGTGSAPANDFLGDVRVSAIFPNANGTTSQLDGSDGNQIDNYLLVDETVPDDDTTYAESADIGDKDTYNYGSLPSSSGTVYGIQLLPRARKTDAGTRKIATIARHSGVEVDSADVTLSTSYVTTKEIRETKPGGGAWSVSDINAAEFGVKVTA